MTAFPRRVFVTGAAGFLGRAITAVLDAHPEVESVIGLDRVGSSPGLEKVRWVRRDIRDPLDEVLQEHEPEAIVHCAYLLRPSRDQSAAHSINVAATERLVAAARSAGVARIVYPSSTTVYGAWPGSTYHREDEAPRPVLGYDYSVQKVAAERALVAGSERGGPVTVILRACVVMGARAANFVADSLGRRALPVPAGADPEMQFLHIDDCVRAVEIALAAPGSGTYNIAGGGTVRFREMARTAGARIIPVPEGLLRGVVDVSWRLRLQNRSPGVGVTFITHPWLASVEKIQRDLAWAPQHTSLQAVQAWASAR